MFDVQTAVQASSVLYPIGAACHVAYAQTYTNENINFKRKTHNEKSFTFSKQMFPYYAVDDWIR